MVCGLNDVQNTTPDRFKAVLKAWHFDVMTANDNNTFRVCKLLRPPKLAWFEASGDPPTSTYINYLGRINAYNNIIDEFNESNGFERVIGFHLEGCRGGRKRRGPGGQPGFQHCFNAWREVRQGAEHCLHLNDVKRSTMMGHLMKYIFYNVL